ncbi:MAG: PfkB family carbohydrate kinase [Candidatus Aminicenantales bacterium]|jgi:sugar/nucleoside kinase (ribokinase family)
MSLVIVGSLAFDTIETPWDRKEKIIGGSCTYCSLAASYFTRPGVVAVVGEDFPADVIAFLKKRHVDLKGLKIVPGGKTFHWQGRYGHDPNQRETVRTDLNVFQNFRPDIPPSYRKADILFLANIDPDLQDSVLRQVEKPRLTAVDTIGLWIQSKREALLRILRRVDIYFGNDEEIRMLTGERNLVKAGRMILAMGPRLVVVKKGEHGALLFGPDLLFGLPALPTETVTDPTGAGDSFAGGFLGYLDQAGSFSKRNIRRAAVYGSVMASFTIEDFGIARYKTLKSADVAARYREFKALVSF